MQYLCPRIKDSSMAAEETLRVKTNSFKAWLLAVRLQTLTGAATPVIIGGTLAYTDKPEMFRWLPFGLSLLFALLMQMSANLVNDYYDFKTGADTQERLGPKRAYAEGWVTRRGMITAISVLLFVAAVAGFPLVFFGGWEMLLVGAACICFCILYTTYFSYAGMGDLLVLLFFGLVPVMFTYYIQLHTLTVGTVVAGLSSGLAINALLLVNNFRDRDTDPKAGKRTVVVRFGASFGKRAYLLCGLLPCLLSFYFLCTGRPFAFLFPLLYLVLHILSWKKMVAIDHGYALNVVLGETARNMLCFGLLLSAGLLL